MMGAWFPETLRLTEDETRDIVAREYRHSPIATECANADLRYARDHSRTWYTVGRVQLSYDTGEHFYYVRSA